MPRRSLSGWRASAAAGLGIIAVAIVLAGHDRAPADEVLAPSPTAPRAEGGQDQDLDQADLAQALPGTWLREQVTSGVRSRRLLRLDSDGTFSEHVLVVSPDGAVSRHEHAGTWLYDGTNLKRKYTLMNGSAPSRLNLPFATFQIRFASKNEFVGENHVHGATVRYRRVEPETQL